VSTVYNFTVTATDGNGYTGSQAYMLTVVPILTGSSLGSNSCSVLTLGACSTPSVTTTLGATELVMIYTTGGLTSSVNSVTGPMTSVSFVDSATFSTGLGLVGNHLYIYEGTGTGTSGAVNANLTLGLLTTTVVDVVQLSGNSTASSFVQHTSGNGASSPVKSSFAAAPGAFNGEVVFEAAPTFTTFTPSPTGGLPATSGLSFNFFVVDPAVQTPTFTMGSGGPWGSIGMEFLHN
jgi:hypothetical protein